MNGAGPRRRLTKLDVANLRGIPRLKAPLELDADLILVTGGNGFGKSSLLQLIGLAANRCLDPRLRVQWLFGPEREGRLTATWDDSEESFLVKKERGQGAP